MPYRTLWHITPSANVDSILIGGIDPAYDIRGKGEIWLVQWKSIAWALAHVSMRKGLPVSQLACLSVHIRGDRCIHFNRGVWKTRYPCYSIGVYQPERVMASWESQRMFMRKHGR
jgi:hypothetical protein